MQKCNECYNFVPAINLDIEDVNKSKLMSKRGICCINNNRRNSGDLCGCGQFKAL